MQALPDLVEPLLEMCLKAGDMICEHYHAPGADRFESKSDDSPLTLADLASDQILQSALAALEPALPVLSEESPPEVAVQRQSWQRYWLVDPLDGTKEFLGRTGEFTINIALIEHHCPVLGLVYLPLERQAYVGLPGASDLRTAGQGATLFQYATEENSVRWVPTPLKCRALTADRPLRILASRRHMGDRLQACLRWLEDNWGPIERDNSGSALKFCQLAAGQGDLYPRFSPCCEWDTAAGQAVVEAAGGAVIGADGQPLRYNCEDSLYSPDFYAVADPTHSLWRRLLAR